MAPGITLVESQTAPKGTASNCRSPRRRPADWRRRRLEGRDKTREPCWSPGWSSFRCGFRALRTGMHPVLIATLPLTGRLWRRPRRVAIVRRREGTVAARAAPRGARYSPPAQPLAARSETVTPRRASSRRCSRSRRASPLSSRPRPRRRRRARDRSTRWRRRRSRAGSRRTAPSSTGRRSRRTRRSAARACVS